MIFHENHLLADDSAEISYFFQKFGKDDAKFVVCCSCDWRLKGLLTLFESTIYHIIREQALTNECTLGFAVVQWISHSLC